MQWRFADSWKLKTPARRKIPEIGHIKFDETFCNLMWPTPQDYNEAVQAPWLSFQDPDLRACAPEINSLGLPKPISGSFASVYQLHGRVGDWAVRCFLHDFGDRQARYQAIAEFLQRTPIPFVVGFQFVERGVLVHGNWFPVLKMDWIGGTPLITYIEQNLTKPSALDSLVNSFSAMCKTFQTHGIAHGDLQHGNIMMVGDELRLVDYDCMFVPALSAFQSNEIGHRNYQHPQRSKNHFGSYLDNFAAWSIYTSLYCLSKDSRLWWSLGGGDECLLFKSEDYAAPGESIAFRVLEHHELRGVRDAAKTLRRLLTMNIEDIPRVGETVADVDRLEKLPAPLTIPGFVESKIASGGISFLNSALGGAPASVLKERTNLRLIAHQTPPEEDALKPLVTGNGAKEEMPWYKNAAVVSSILHPPRAVYPPAPAPMSSKFAYWHKKRKRGQRLRATLVAMGLVAAVNAFIGAVNVHTHQPAVLSGRLYTFQARNDNQLAVVYNSGVQLQRAGKFTEAIKAYLLARERYGAAGLSAYQKEMGMCDFQIGRCLVALERPKQAVHFFGNAKNEFAFAHVFVPTLLTEWAATEEKLDKYAIAGSLYSECLNTVRCYPSMTPSHSINALRRCAIALIKEKDYDDGARFLSDALMHLPMSLDEKRVTIGDVVRDLSSIADDFERDKKDVDYARRVRTLALNVVAEAKLAAPRTAEIQAYEGMAKNADLAGNHTAAEMFEQTVKELQEKNKREMSNDRDAGAMIGGERSPSKWRSLSGPVQVWPAQAPLSANAQAIEPRQRLPIPRDFAPKKLTGQYKF